MATYEKTCAAALCGKAFRTDRHEQRFCSAACVNLAHGSGRRRELVCAAPGCGRSFIGRFGARYCSNRCRVQHGAWSYAAGRGA